MKIAPWRSSPGRAAVIGLSGFLIVCAACGCGPPRPDYDRAGPNVPGAGQPSGLPLPSRLPVSQFEQKLFEFLNSRRYAQLGWHRDKEVRDTGPFIGGKYYGTHPAVRVYYSPGVVQWLANGRVGKISDGEIIVKEQYAAPAIRHERKTDDELWRSLESWTVMVKDSAGSHDGWFWSNPTKGQCAIDNNHYPFAYPVSGFGLYCVRCHAATQSSRADPSGAENEFVFASLRNVAGFPGEPLRFRVDDSWRADVTKPTAYEPATADGRDGSHPKCTLPRPPQPPSHTLDRRFQEFFSSIKPVKLAETSRLAPVTHDWIVSSRDPSQGFVNSNQCMSCHAGLAAPFGPTMFVPAGPNAEYGAPGWDVSPHGEWRWTPMGLAGRDPLFHAQLESETEMLREEFRSDPSMASRLGDALHDSCLRCHGPMGKRQFDIDHANDSAKLLVDRVDADIKNVGPDASKYGALARDGVGCLVCHRLQPRPQPEGDRRPYLQYFLETSTSGNFHLGKKGEVYGPFKDDEIAAYAMQHATGLQPKHSDYLKSSQLCATCHTVAMPLLDKPVDLAALKHERDECAEAETVPLFRKFHHHLEQATYLEWLNSAYENEIHKQNPQAKSCQDCHMSRGLKDERLGIDVAQIRTRIAVVQDRTYPEAENVAPPEHQNVRFREEGYRRHNFSGLNVFLLELFNQFDDVLGVAKTDFMTGSSDGIAHAIDNFVRTAQNDVASIAVQADWRAPNRVAARVVVTNKVGHRFPSGVGFRRAFLELLVVELPSGGSSERILWASGRTNELGILVGADEKPLATEFCARDPVSGQERYQEHHDLITSPDQVQVYETLRRNKKGNFTASFTLGSEILKDNRLLPRGWKAEGPGGGLTGMFLEATHPDSTTARDPRYKDGSGSDEVGYRIELPTEIDPERVEIRATLYYQAISPYFLRRLFETAPNGPATRRLHYLCSHVNLRGTPIENWKLPIASAACKVKRPGQFDPAPGIKVGASARER